MIAFGRFQLDPKRRVLLADGQAVKLQARAFDILELLVIARDRAVSREEIIAQVWHGQIVTDGNLAVQMSNLRRALGEHGAEQFIITANRGYRFVGDVLEVPSADSAGTVGAIAHTKPDAVSSAQSDATARLPIVMPRPSWGRRILLSLCGVMFFLAGVAAWRYFTAPPQPPRLSLAVLPFRNLSADRSQDYVADAISDDLTTDLAHIPGSVVIARESADAYRGRALPTAEIGRALDVRYLLEGSIRGEEGRLHINAQLIDAATGSHLWAERFDKPLANVAEARNDIVERIASALHFQLDNLESARSEHDRPDNPDALDLFFRARAILDSDDSLAGFNKAQQLLESAIVKQPDFGDAHAELASMLLRKVSIYDEEGDWVEATKAIARALQLVPRNAKVLAARGREFFVEGNYLEAEASARAALEIEPSSLEAHWLLANCAWFLGQLDTEASMLRAISQLNPEDPLDAKHRSLLFGVLDVLNGHPKDAIELFYAAISGDPDPAPDTAVFGRAEYTRVWLIAAYDLNGEEQKASDLYKNYAKIWPNRSVWRFGAYFPKIVAKLPAMAKVLDALRRSGMPMYADARVGLAPPGTTCGEGAFSLTPLSLSGGSVVDTAQVAESLAGKTPPLVIDVGFGAGSVPGAVWFDPAGPAESTMDFVDRIVSSGAISASGVAIVLMGDGPFGCDAYDAARHLIAEGYHKVWWYRGGAEAWVASHQVFDDRRK